MKIKKSISFLCLFSIILVGFTVRAKDIRLNNLNTATLKNQNINIPSQVVVYSSLPKARYGFSDLLPSTSDIGKSLTDKLNSDGVKGYFLDTSNLKYKINEGYKVHREIIAEKINNYSNKILIDVRIAYNKNTKEQQYDNGITIFVGKKNENFMKNKNFAQYLVNQIKKTDSNVDSKITLSDGVFNQDMSNNAIMVSFGNTNTNKDDIERDLKAFSTALKNLMQ